MRRIHGKSTLLRIERAPGYADKTRNYKIVLDDKVIGEIASGQTKEFDVGSGKHVLYLTVDWAKSNSITFDADSGESLRFRCASRAKGIRVLLSIVYATVLSHRYIKLESI